MVSSFYSIGDEYGDGVGQHCGKGDIVGVGVAGEAVAVGVLVAVGVGSPHEVVNAIDIHEIMAFALKPHVVVAIAGAPTANAFIGTALPGLVGSVNSVKPLVGPLVKDDAVSY